jgi:hypothetical protein
LYQRDRYRAKKQDVPIGLCNIPGSVLKEVKMSDVTLFRLTGHHGTGDVELAIRNLDDPEKAKPLIQKSFEEN